MTTTTIYDPSTQQNPVAGGYLAFLQLPTAPLYVQPFPFANATSIDDVFEVDPLTQTSSSAGTTVTTNGTAFVISPGYEPFDYWLTNGASQIPTGNTLSLTPNEGYAGYTNYTLDLDLTNVNPLTFDINSVGLIPVNQAFPVLDPDAGFSLSFDLAITEEQSNANRAGFNVIVISNDLSKGAEFGFKEVGDNTDYVFIQNATFSEGEKSTTSLEISDTNQYTITFQDDGYTLSVNGSVLLTGQLRDYVFDPASSDPALPSAVNPYETQNLLFFGDNTDQGYSTFTLGEIIISPITSNGGTTVDIPDFNGDGQADIVWRNSNGKNVIWLMNGTSPSSSVSLPNVPTGWELNALGDFDGNGTHDLVWRNDAAAKTIIWRMNGTSPNGSVELNQVPTGWSVAEAADFNGDGETDLLWRNQNSGQNTIWLMNDTTPQSSAKLASVGGAWEVGGAADFNDDGHQDLLWRNSITGKNLIWLMDGVTTTSSVEIASVAQAWSIAGITDFDRDGNADIQWRNEVNGKNLVWLMNDLSSTAAVTLAPLPTNWTAIV